MNAADLQGIRAVQLLVHLGTDDAKKLLRLLAAGADEARLTREARAALECMGESTVSAVK